MMIIWPARSRKQNMCREVSLTGKRLLRFLPILLVCAGLLVFSQASALAAAEAFQLWWNSVLPALFPFYLCTSILLRQGVLPVLSGTMRRPAALLRLPPEALPCYILGGVAGYPTGARLSAALGIPGYAAYCNLCSPMFLIAVIAAGMLNSRACVPLLCLAHYGSGLLLLLIAPRNTTDGTPAKQDADPQKGNGGPMRMVGDGMAAMLQIGGCIAAALVFSSLLKQFGLYALLDALARRLGIPEGLLPALTQGLLEFTGGCKAICSLGLPLRTAATCCAFVASFGGVCVFLQTRLFVSGGVRHYFSVKLLQGAVAAVIAYLTTPLFLPTSAAVMHQQAETYAINALSGVSLLLASAVAVFATYLGAITLTAVFRQTGSSGS